MTESVPGESVDAEQVVEEAQDLSVFVLGSFNELWVAYVALMSMASILVYFGSKRSFFRQFFTRDTQTMTQKDASLLPLVLSVVLFGLFLALKFLSADLVNLGFSIVFGLAASFMIGKLFSGILVGIFDPESNSFSYLTIGLNIHVPVPLSYLFEDSTFSVCLADVFGVLAGGAIVSSYFTTKSWILCDIIGATMCIISMSELSLSTFKNGLIVLWGLFLYDIFWVFGTTVMVTVASRFDIPVKLEFPRRFLYDLLFTLLPQWFTGPGVGADLSTQRTNVMLGLGDIVIPGFYLAMMYRFDVLRGGVMPETDKIESIPKPHFTVVMIAYVLALVSAVTVMHNTQHAQPVLLYITPALTLSTLAICWLCGTLKEWWAYCEDDEEEKETTEAPAEDTASTAEESS